MYAYVDQPAAAEVLQYNLAAPAGLLDVAFGSAYLTQAPADRHVITCNVPEVIVIEDDEAPPDAHVDAACVCCELVARVGSGTSDVHLVKVLGAVLQAFTGRAQPPEEVERLFHDRFKSAGGGQLMIEGQAQQQLLLEGPAQDQQTELASESPEKRGRDTAVPQRGLANSSEADKEDSTTQQLVQEKSVAGAGVSLSPKKNQQKSRKQPGARSVPAKRQQKMAAGKQDVPQASEPQSERGVLRHPELAPEEGAVVGAQRNVVQERGPPEPGVGKAAPLRFPKVPWVKT